MMRQMGAAEPFTGVQLAQPAVEALMQTINVSGSATHTPANPGKKHIQQNPATPNRPLPKPHTLFQSHTYTSLLSAPRSRIQFPLSHIHPSRHLTVDPKTPPIPRRQPSSPFGLSPFGKLEHELRAPNSSGSVAELSLSPLVLEP